MIEVQFDLKLNSFLINSTGDASGFPPQMSARTLRLSCGQILSARQLTDDTPTADFDFLDSSSKREGMLDTDREFDEQLIKYLLEHTHIDISKVTIAYGEAGYRLNPKDTNSNEIGRLFIKKQPNQVSLDVDLVIKQNEFDAIWELATKQSVKNMIGKFICFNPKNIAPAADNETRVAAILASSLQMMPDA
jgi:hypothetical protein